MKLKWYCGMQTAPDYLDGSPAPECDGEGVAYQEEDWGDQGLTPCAQCHKCGQTLEDPSHYSSYDEEETITPYLEEIAYDWFDEGDHVLYEGGVWRVVRPDSKGVAIEWVAGPRTSGVVYATGVRSRDLQRLTDMEVVAYAARAETGE